MRMRKKKNLEFKLSECSDYLIPCHCNDLNFKTAIKSKNYINYQEIFSNENPVCLEIGCGKGKFISESALQNPNINFLAVEKNSNVLLDACRKAIDLNISNLRFIKLSAEYLPCFIPPKSIKTIYLNFSCPFPKKSYAGHRLTNKKFLYAYREMLTENGEIHQKTDNMHFFEYSIEQFSESGYTLKNLSFDLHNSDFSENIETEYENKFSNAGLPIYRLEAYTKK